MTDVKKQSLTKGTIKELEIVASEQPSLMKIKYKDGGEIPEILKGLWNNRGMAQQQIDLYLLSRTPKKVAA